MNKSFAPIIVPRVLKSVRFFCLVQRSPSEKSALGSLNGSFRGAQPSKPPEESPPQVALRSQPRNGPDRQE